MGKPPPSHQVHHLIHQNRRAHSSPPPLVAMTVPAHNPGRGHAPAPWPGGEDTHLPLAWRGTCTWPPGLRGGTHLPLAWEGTHLPPGGVTCTWPPGLGGDAPAPGLGGDMHLAPGLASWVRTSPGVCLSSSASCVLPDVCAQAMKLTAGAHKSNNI